MGYSRRKVTWAAQGSWLGKCFGVSLMALVNVVGLDEWSRVEPVCDMSQTLWPVILRQRWSRPSTIALVPLPQSRSSPIARLHKWASDNVLPTGWKCNTFDAVISKYFEWFGCSFARLDVPKVHGTVRWPSGNMLSISGAKKKEKHSEWIVQISMNLSRHVILTRSRVESRQSLIMKDDLFQLRAWALITPNLVAWLTNYL